MIPRREKEKAQGKPDEKGEKKGDEKKSGQWLFLSPVQDEAVSEVSQGGEPLPGDA